MSIDTDRFAGELRARLDIEELHSTLDFDTVLAGSKRARRRRAVIASTVVAGSLVAAVLAGPPLVDLGHRMADAAQRGRFAKVDGVAGNLSKPLDVAWRASGSFAGVSEPSGTILLDTDHAFEALDPATGQVRWSVPVDDDHFCRPPSGIGSGTMDSATAKGPERVLCAAIADGTIQLRDVATGDVVTTMTVPWPEWHAILIDGAVVAFGVDEEGHAVARSTDPATGGVNWTYRGEAAIPPGGDGFGTVVGPGTVGLVAGAWSVSLNATTGEPVARSGAVEQRPVRLAGGFSAIQSSALHGPPDAWSVRVLAPDGTELLRVPGLLEQPLVDDGSMRGLVFVRNLSTNAIDAIDVTTGATLWSHGGFRPDVLVDQHLVATTDIGGKLLVLDAATGEQIWTAQLHLPNYGLAPITDGVNVLTLEDAAGQPNLVARDLATGSVVWAEPWDPGEGALLHALPTGDVLASTDGGITMFRP